MDLQIHFIAIFSRAGERLRAYFYLAQRRGGAEKGFLH